MYIMCSFPPWYFSPTNSMFDILIFHIKDQAGLQQAVLQMLKNRWILASSLQTVRAVIYCTL